MKKVLAKVKKLNKNAVIPFKAHESDFCYDVVAVSEEEIAPNVWKYGLGLAFELGCESEVEAPSGGKTFSCVSIDFRPRSSVWKTGMVLSNSTGTIDQDYRGEVSAVFYHVMPNMPRYKVGDKIGQIKFGYTLPMRFEVVNELSETERGDGGYGSTGLHTNKKKTKNE